MVCKQADNQCEGSSYKDDGRPKGADHGEEPLPDANNQQVLLCENPGLLEDRHGGRGVCPRRGRWEGGVVIVPCLGSMSNTGKSKGQAAVVSGNNNDSVRKHSCEEELESEGKRTAATVCHHHLTNARTRCIRIAKQTRQSCRRPAEAKTRPSCRQIRGSADRRPPAHVTPAFASASMNHHQHPICLTLLAGLAYLFTALESASSTAPSPHKSSAEAGRPTTPRAPRLPSSTRSDVKGRNRDANFSTRSLTRTPCTLRLVPPEPASSTRPPPDAFDD